MRTPEKLAEAMQAISEHIADDLMPNREIVRITHALPEYQEGIRREQEAWTSLLTAWRDECVEEAKAFTPAATAYIKELQTRLDMSLHERDRLREALKDPALVWTAMLREEIARPRALDHYEECKARVCELEVKLSELRAERDRFRAELWDFTRYGALAAFRSEPAKDREGK
jgi:chromosome segregation ATPase